MGSSDLVVGALGVQDVSAMWIPGTPNEGNNITYGSGFLTDGAPTNGGALVDVGLWAVTSASPNGSGGYTVAAGSLLTSVSVSPTDTLIDGYRYHSIFSLTLSANTQYLIGALVGKGITFYIDGANNGGQPDQPYTGNGITLQSSLFTSDNTLAAPTTPMNSDGIGATRTGGANFLTVPEPASISLLALSAGGLLMRRRAKA